MSDTNKNTKFFFLETFENFFFFSNNLNFFQYYSFKRKTDETPIFDSLNSVEFSELKKSNSINALQAKVTIVDSAQL